MNTSALPRLLVIAGPTASGKSALALALAQRLGGAIVNADASQVYRDLRVITARPPPDEEIRAPHRLFGHVDAADTGYSAARWALEARSVIAAEHAAGRLPILVGGTGLYLRTLLEGIAPVPEIDPAVRAAVRALDPADARAALLREDAVAAARLNAGDSQRILRALEVVRSTGRPLVAWQAERHGGIAAEVDLHAAILDPRRDWLTDRIDARFAELLPAAQAEVAALLARDDVADDAPARRAIGVDAVAAWIDGTLDRAAAIASGAMATRRYAKRQATWFRHQPPAHWLRITDTGEDERWAALAAAWGLPPR